MIFMLESRVENYLKKKVEKLGGKAFKWAPVGVTGVPDRMVLLPGGKIIFVELKAPGKKARKLQEYRAKQLRELGFQVECLDTIERIDRLFTDWSKKMNTIQRKLNKSTKKLVNMRKFNNSYRQIRIILRSLAKQVVKNLKK